LFFLAYHLLFEVRFLLRRSVLVQLTGLYALGALICLPFFAPLAVELTRPVRSADLDESGWIRYSADLLAFISPSPFTPWGARLAPPYARTVLGTNTTEGTAYPGIVTLLVCIIGAAFLRRNAARRSISEARDPLRIVRPWFFIMLGTMLFSLGPVLKWLDQPVIYRLGDELQTNVTLPYALFQMLPFIDGTRTPGRFNLLAGLALGVTAAVILTRLLSLWERTGRRQMRLSGPLIFGLIAAMLIDSQLFFPAPTTPAVLPPFFESLASRTDIRAVFDVPWADNLAAKEATYLQTAHHKPLIAGHVVRTTPVDPAKLTMIEAAALGTMSDPAITLEQARAFLRDQGVDLIIAHLVALQPAQVAALEARFGPSVYQDAQYRVYDVPQTAASAPPLLATDSATGRAMYLAQAGLVALTGLGPAQTVTLDGRPFFAPTDAERVEVWLPAGFHGIGGALPARIGPPSATGEPPTRWVGATNFEGRITSRGVSATRSGAPPESLRVTLTWRAEADWSADSVADLRIFIHLLDSTGTLVAQADPTVQGPWRAGQILATTATVPLRGVGPGSYTLSTGWYRFSTKARLLIQPDPGADGPGSGTLDRIQLGKISIR
jgi:hypothetical protein